MDMSVKNIVLVGVIAAVLFGILTFAYAYTKAGALQELITGLAGIFGGGTETAPIYALAAAEWYFLVGMACFTSLGTAITQSLVAAGPFASLLEAIFPNPIMFYIIGIISGIIPGFIFLKEKSKFVDGLVAALIPAVVVTAIIAVITTIAVAQMSATAGMPMEISMMTGTDYFLVFIVTFVFIAIGTMIGAVIRHMMAKK